MGEMSCELCGTRASMFCESDQARLCWECDERVHSANFLVEKHTRVLLCHACHSLTPWTASGRRLGVSLSLCHSCSSSTPLSSALTSVILESGRCPPPRDESRASDQRDEEAGPASFEGEEDSYTDDFDSDEEDEDYDTDETDDTEEEEDNQVVPWTPSALPPGPSSSSSEDGGDSQSPTYWRRFRNFVPDDPDLDSEDEASSIQTVAEASTLPDRESLSSDQEGIPPVRKRPRTAARRA